MQSIDNARELKDEGIQLADKKGLIDYYNKVGNQERVSELKKS